MNEITQLLHIDPLLLQALREDIPEEKKAIFSFRKDTYLWRCENHLSFHKNY